MKEILITLQTRCTHRKITAVSDEVYEKLMKVDGGDLREFQNGEENEEYLLLTELLNLEEPYANSADYENIEIKLIGEDSDDC
jgi:hypothetical protein